MSSTTGTMFRVTTFGESHGRGIGAVVDGCPSRLPLNETDLQKQLDRRRPGQSSLTTTRAEKDLVQILSGVENGLTLGTPIALFVENTDRRPTDYEHLRNVPRPSHADYTYQMKYGITAASGGGRASARETIGRVAAGTIAEKFLATKYGVRIVAWVSTVGEITAPDLFSDEEITREMVDRFPVRCPHEETALRMADLIEAVRDDNDSIGGIVSCLCLGVPAGWGEPIFDKLSAELAKAQMSIPAAKGFEFGSGFASASKHGSELNDLFTKTATGLRPATNHSGGIQGGISNGAPIYFRVAFKPPATINRPQKTADLAGNQVELKIGGRHDPCVAPRAVPVVEAMTALVLADAALIAGCRHL